MLKLICKELGVDIGEEWVGNDGKTYIIENEAILEYYESEAHRSADYSSWIMSGNEVYTDILQGKLKPIFKPLKGEMYYIPNPLRNLCNWRYEDIVWEDDEYDRWALENNLVYRTKDEAIEHANKILDIIKQLF